MSDAVRKFFAGALMAIGGLIAALCGTCTLVAVGVGLADVFGGSAEVGGMIGAAIMLALVGGVPTLAGVLVFRAGWRRFPRSKRASKAAVAVFSDDEPGPP